MRNYGFWTYFDFAAFLVVCTLVCAAIWALDAWVLAPRREAKRAEEESRGEKRWKKTVEFARSFFPVFFVVLVLRSFLVEPFTIPTGSMIPTLLVGDFILVNKFAYGVRLPVANTKIINWNEPKRGEVVVFRFPPEPRVNYIKRVIGLPGDTVEYRDKRLFINGAEVTHDLKLDFKPNGVGRDISAAGVDTFEEHLGNVDHIIQHMPERRGKDYPTPPDTGVVPPGHYFVMGDNRDDSADSRFWGFVPEANLVGRAFFIWFNFDKNAPWGEMLKWKRIGGDIK